ncbi:GrpB family protein [Microbacterium sp. 22242]|uniref:GrpB family protein n=1 Tax=Microbacterium sp. 22242 TaxID=3453896 RepID=UPI003F852004
MAAPQIVPYDPAWPSLAEAWLERIRRAVAAVTPEPLRLDHIGSTAVPGLDAKGFLDLQLLMAELPDEAQMSTALASCGFRRARGSRPDSPGVDRDVPRPGTSPAHHEKLLFFREEPHPQNPGVILHVRRMDSSFADFVLCFRDWLRSDGSARADYAAHKRALAAEFAGADDYDDYTRAKSVFMDEAQRRMGWPRPPRATAAPTSR